MAFDLETFKRYEDALKRIANTHDKCHVGYKGPWQDVAFEAIFQRPMTEDEFWQGLNETVEN
jgi:hypothetical protein